MASDDEIDLGELLGRVSKKLGWQNAQHKDANSALRKPMGSVKHKKKKTSVQSSSKKEPRKSRKDTSSSSDKENGLKGHNHQDHYASKGKTKSKTSCTNPPELQTSPCKVLQTENTELVRCVTTDHLKNDSDEDYSTATTKEIVESPTSKDLGKDGASFLEATTEAVQSNGNELRNAAEISELIDGNPTRDIEQDDPSASHTGSSNETVPKVDEFSVNSEPFRKAQPLSSDEDSFVPKIEICSGKPPSQSSKDEDDDLESPFLLHQRKSESPKPMRWQLTPSPNTGSFKLAKSTENIAVVVSDSDSDSNSLHTPDLESDDSTEETTSPIPKDAEPDMPFSPLQSYSETPEPMKWFLTPPPKQAKKRVEKITLVSASDTDSDSPDDTCRQTLSLSERLSKNFKKHKGLGKPSKKGGAGSGVQVKNSSSEDSDAGEDGCSWRREKEVAVDKDRNLQNLRPSRCDSSDEDDNFEQFLQAIRTPHQKSQQHQPPSPTVDEDQYENSFIDDSPVGNRDSGDDVYYYRHINSDQKIFSDKKKEKETKTTSTFSQFRLPQFSDSDDDDDDDSVFATPRPPAVKVAKPVSSASKRFTPAPSKWRDASQSRSKTDFLFSLSTPKADCTSSSPYVSDFKKHREVLTRKLFDIYNQTVFDSKLPSDFSIKWNNRMRKTAGYCYYTKTKVGGQRNARIELSEKVCDTAERLRDTMIHELCHTACWLINGVNDGHGRFWKYWAAKANQAHPCIPIIKRCHSYDITTKYKYQCITCKSTIGRHSKSINTNKFCCAYCKGNLMLLPSLNKDGKVSKVRTPNKFAMFVKENYGSVKRENTSMKHADIMRHLSQDFSKKATISV